MSDVPTYPIAVIAKLCDCTERHIRRLAQEGYLTRPDGKKEWPITVVTEYIRYLREKAYKGATSSLHDEKTRLAKEQADRAELENKVRRDELIEVSKVIKASEESVSIAKTKILAIPSTVSPYLTNIEKVAEVESILEGSINDALSELSRRGAEIMGSAAEADGEPVV